MEDPLGLCIEAAPWLHEIFPTATAKGSTLVGKGVWGYGLNVKSDAIRRHPRTIRAIECIR